MFTLDNTDLPITDKFTEDSLGLSLFWTDISRSNDEVVFYTADPQSNYNTVTNSPFNTVTEDNPVPTNSTLYSFRGQISPTGLTEAPTLFYLDDNKYYFDYLDRRTYIVIPEATTSLDSIYEVSYSYYDFSVTTSGINIYLEIDLSNNDFDFDDISAVNIGGLAYSKSLVSNTAINEFYYSSSDQTLYIHGSITCGPTPDLEVDITFDLTLSEAVESFSVLRFDLSSSNFDYIDYLAHNNINYYPSTEITSGTLIYNRLDKIALCLR